MKIHMKKQHSRLLGVLVVSFFCCNIQLTLAGQSVTTASTPSSTSPSTQSMGGMSMSMGSATGPGSTDDYWRQVRGGDFQFTGKTRTYYIAAEEVDWDYAPQDKNVITGENGWSGAAVNFVTTNATRIGSKYVKCLYHEYTNNKFNVQKKRAPEDEYLGFLGPSIRAEVGDIIQIVFINKCSFPASVHPHAVFYNKDSEGAPYNDTTSGYNKTDDIVPTGGSHTYTWKVPERAGPGPMDGSSIMWMYHSHTDENKDFYAGLVGCMEITAKGMGNADGSPKDVDREIFIMYSIMNENGGHYLEKSYRKFVNADPSVPVPTTDPGFTGANSKDSINGYIYGNGPVITMKKGERVRWYVMSMGSFPDSHTPQWHGNTVLMGGMRMDVVSVLPAEMVTADMSPDNVGIWMFHCHVADHLVAGMATLYQVLDDGSYPGGPGGPGGPGC